MQHIWIKRHIREIQYVDFLGEILIWKKQLEQILWSSWWNFNPDRGDIKKLLLYFRCANEIVII